MAEEDRLRWDARYEADRSRPRRTLPPPPTAFAPYEELFPSSGRALDVACGTGTASVWLAGRGLDVLGLDISPLALAKARRLAAATGVEARCRFEAADLDEGLPPGPLVDVVLCHMFRDARLDRPFVDRLAPGGLLAVASRSQVGAGPGPYRAAPGELRRAFGALAVIADDEIDGMAWLLARKLPVSGTG